MSYLTIKEQGDSVLVHNTSIITKEVSSMLIPMPYEQFKANYCAYQRGMHLQKAFSTLNAEQREFIHSGITPEEWSAYVVDEQE